MLQKLHSWLVKKQQDQKKKIELIKAKEYYKVIRSGALFLQFIKADIEQMKKQQINRHMRRRFETSLDKFELNEEIVQYYKAKIDNVLNYIKIQMNRPEQKPVEVKGNKAEIKKENK